MDAKPTVLMERAQRVLPTKTKVLVPTTESPKCERATDSLESANTESLEVIAGGNDGAWDDVQVEDCSSTMKEISIDGENVPPYTTKGTQPPKVPAKADSVQQPDIAGDAWISHTCNVIVASSTQWLSQTTRLCNEHGSVSTKVSVMDNMATRLLACTCLASLSGGIKGLSVGVQDKTSKRCFECLEWAMQNRQHRIVENIAGLAPLVESLLLLSLSGEVADAPQKGAVEKNVQLVPAFLKGTAGVSAVFSMWNEEAADPIQPNLDENSATTISEVFKQITLQLYGVNDYSKNVFTHFFSANSAYHGEEVEGVAVTMPLAQKSQIVRAAAMSTLQVPPPPFPLSLPLVSFLLL
jgi:hypothetical protein